MNEFEVDYLRWMTTINEHKDQTEIGSLRQVVHDHTLEFVPISRLRVAIARQVHEAPFVVNQEEIDQLRAAWCGGDFSQRGLVRQQVDQRRLADIRATNKSKLLKVGFRAGSQVRRTGLEGSGVDFHASGK